MEVLGLDGKLRHTGFFQLANMPGRDATSLLDDGFLANLKVKCRYVTPQALGDELHGVGALVVHIETRELVEHGEDFFRVVTQGAQENRRGELAATVDAGEYHVLGIKLEVEPGTTVGNNAGRVEQFAR